MPARARILPLWQSSPIPPLLERSYLWISVWLPLPFVCSLNLNTPQGSRPCPGAGSGKGIVNVEGEQFTLRALHCRPLVVLLDLNRLGFRLRVTCPSRGPLIARSSVFAKLIFFHCRVTAVVL